MPEKFSPGEWGEIEKKVDAAEIAQREAAKAAGELAEGKAAEEEAEILEETRKERRAEAETLLGPEGSPERELVSLRWKNLVKAFRGSRELEAEHDELVEKEVAVLSRIEAEPTGAQIKALERLRGKQDAVSEKRENLIASSPEAYFGLHLKEMKEMKRQLSEGRIVETPYVKRQAEDVTAHVRSGKPVLLYGHLGTGKSELAMHVAKNYLGKEALVVSGSKHTSLAELYGHQVLAVDKLKQEEREGFIRSVEAKYEEWRNENPTADEGEKGRAHDRIKQAYSMVRGGGTISDFYLGPVYQAMEEGRLVIIDEVNAIPHEVLISLNHILTRKVGDTVGVQQDSGKKVAIQEGFGVIMTSNLNQGDSRYVDRQDLDPAFLSRLYKLEHDYVPQRTEGALRDEAGPENELYQILLARMMDKNGNIEAPEGTLKDLWRLAQAARVSQDVFAGKQVKDAFYFKQGGARATQYMLKESVLSLRGMDAIISQWQKEGYRRELDYYLYKEFVGQSTTPADKAYLYQLFKDQYGFFQSEGWEPSPDYGSGGVVRSFDVPVPENRPKKLSVLGPRDVVEAAYGEAPERAEWPEADEADAEAGELSPEVMGLEEWRSGFGAEFEDLGQEVMATCKIA